MTNEAGITTNTARPRSRVLAAAALYFVLVFGVGLLLGPIRVLWLEPAFGQTLSVLFETPFLIGAMIIAARLAPRWTRMSGSWLSYAAVGFFALAFQQIADLAVGFGLRGMTLGDQLSYFSTLPGYIYLANLIVFALAPLLMQLRRGSRALHQDKTPVS